MLLIAVREEAEYSHLVHAFLSLTNKNMKCHNYLCEMRLGSKFGQDERCKNCFQKVFQTVIGHSVCISHSVGIFGCR